MNLFSKKDIILENTIYEKSYFKRIISFIIGCLIISLSYNIFITENKLVPGGVGGIAVIVNNLIGIKNTTVIIILNVILIILSYFLLPKEKTKRSILGTLLFPFTTLQCS